MAVGLTQSEECPIDFTPELRAEALEIVAQLRTGPLYTPAVVIDEAEGGV